MAEEEINANILDIFGDETLDEMEKAFFPEYITDSPSIYFVFKFIIMPLVIIYIVWAYVKTIRFAYNTILFYKRFLKKDEMGEFEIPTLNHSKRDQKKSKGKKTAEEASSTKANDFKR